MAKSKKKFAVSDEDRDMVLELARKYLKNARHPSIQRWAWEKILPFALPRLSAQELKTADNGFKLIIEDYRDDKTDLAEFGLAADPDAPLMHSTLGKIPVPDPEKDS